MSPEYGGSVHPENQRGARIAGGAASEQADAAAAKSKGLDELGNGAEPGRALGVAVHQAATVLDHAIQLLGGDAAIVQRLPGNVGREIERRRLGQGALPAGERGRPRTTQRDVRALEPHV